MGVSSLNHVILNGGSPEPMLQTTVVRMPSRRSDPKMNGFIDGFSVFRWQKEIDSVTEHEDCASITPR